MKKSGMVFMGIAMAAALAAVPAVAQTGDGADKVKAGGSRTAEMPPLREAAAERPGDGQRKGKKGRKTADAALNSDLASETARGRDHAQAQGSETAQEIRDRRDERKAIMDEYKAERKADKDAMKAEAKAKGDRQPGTADSVENVETVDSAKKAKKPWWKFWGE